MNVSRYKKDYKFIQRKKNSDYYLYFEKMI